MAKKKNNRYLKISVEKGEVGSAAKNLRKHLMLLQKLAMNNLYECDDLTAGELEAFQAVTGLMIELQAIEDKHPGKKDSPP